MKKLLLAIVGALAAIGTSSPALAQPIYLTCQAAGAVKAEHITLDESNGTATYDTFGEGRSTSAMFSADKVTFVESYPPLMAFDMSIDRRTLGFTSNPAPGQAFGDSSSGTCVIEKAQDRQF